VNRDVLEVFSDRRVGDECFRVAFFGDGFDWLGRLFLG
jgi:hypothetical protein